MITTLIVDLSILNPSYLEALLESVNLSVLGYEFSGTHEKPKFQQFVSWLVDQELMTLKKSIQDLDRNKNESRNLKKSSSTKHAKLLDIEDIFERNQLSFDREFFVQIYPADFRVNLQNRPDLAKLFSDEPENPQNESLGILVEIQGDQHFDSLSGKLNIRQQHKLRLLKRLYPHVSWVDKSTLRELSKIDENSKQVEKLFSVLKMNRQ